jgi:hypothetical protein
MYTKYGHDVITNLIETYGIEKILSDSNTSLEDMLILLNDLGWIDLNIYEEFDEVS